MRAAKRMLRAGVAAVQIEDQVLPKRCGHLDGKELIPWQEAWSRIAAVKDAAPSLLVVARTDAFAVEGLQGAVERARRYRQAGADIIFPEALRDAKTFRAFRGEVEGPLLANMTEFGKTEYLTVEEFRQLGYQLVLFPVSVFRVAAGAARAFLRTLQAEGTQRGCLSDMLTREELYRLIRYEEYGRHDEELARRAGALADGR
jgi:methylisocitrate lyase